MEKVREYAGKQKTSFNELAKNLLAKNVGTNGYEVLMEIADSKSKNNLDKNWDWNRDEIYED